METTIARDLTRPWRATMLSLEIKGYVMAVLTAIFFSLASYAIVLHTIFPTTNYTVRGFVD
jgi:hypothetical protein